MSTQLFRSLYQYKAWVNGELFASLKSVPAASIQNQMNLIVRVLNHVVVVDQIFKANVAGERHAFKALDTIQTTDLGELSELVSNTDAWYLNYVDSLNESQLGEPLEFSFANGSAGNMSREQMLAHVITHGNSHRGQIGAILYGTQVPFPRDIFTHFLHREP